jgi:hypothetical protein
MSKRESHLLILFGVTGLILLLLWGYQSYTGFRVRLQNDRVMAETELREAELYLKSSDSIRDEIEWLSQHEPQPQAGEQVPTKLQQLASAEASQAGMLVKKMEILPDRSAESEETTHYKVGQVKFTVTGEEKNLYAWFDRMHSPNDFRAISQLTLSPNREDDSKIDCQVVFDQWYVPLTPEM